jgi:hypothetical protein
LDETVQITTRISLFYQAIKVNEKTKHFFSGGCGGVLKQSVIKEGILQLFQSSKNMVKRVQLLQNIW